MQRRNWNLIQILHTYGKCYCQCSEFLRICPQVWYRQNYSLLCVRCSGVSMTGLYNKTMNLPVACLWLAASEITDTWPHHCHLYILSTKQTGFGSTDVMYACINNHFRIWTQDLYFLWPYTKRSFSAQGGGDWYLANQRLILGFNFKLHTDSLQTGLLIYFKPQSDINIQRSVTVFGNNPQYTLRYEVSSKMSIISSV